MPKLIDKESVIKMAITGFTRVEIAKRLGCSERQVRRILKKHPVMEGEKGLVKDGEVESAMRIFFLKWESGERVGERFGVTRQAVLK